jgi:hypothetical protein
LLDPNSAFFLRFRILRQATSFQRYISHPLRRVSTIVNPWSLSNFNLSLYTERMFQF